MRLIRNYDTWYPNGGLYNYAPLVEYIELDEHLGLLSRRTVSTDQDKAIVDALPGKYVSLLGQAIGTLDLPEVDKRNVNKLNRWLFVDAPICPLSDVDLLMSQHYIDDMTGHFMAEHEGLLILDIDYPRFSGDEWHTEEEWDLFYQLAHHRR